MSDTSRKRRILLVAGGWSPERDISLLGAEAIARALRKRGHEVSLWDLSDGFDRLLEAAAGQDAAFLNLHGQPGEDGLVQALLERAGCPYQGSGPAGSFLALNKAAAKALFRRAGLRVPPGVFLPRRPPADWKPDLRFPLFVKSNTGGSSLDLFRARNEAELETALDALFGAGQEVLIEEMLTGSEVTCGVLDVNGKGPEALPPILIVPRRDFFDYHDKYAPDGAQELCPAPLPDEVLDRVRRAAVAAHRCLGLAAYSRADFILTPDSQLYLLEVNTLPGMTAASLVPKEAAALGMDFGELLESLLEDAIRRHGAANR
ncbi:MAG: D-alanine--D-alanine ligase [Desulfovibrionaceae bacterium]|nr:D-alanine--D-alanine ligase [Desulfovibrionaceae bacterium]